MVNMQVPYFAERVIEFVNLTQTMTLVKKVGLN